MLNPMVLLYRSVNLDSARQLDGLPVPLPYSYCCIGAPIYRTPYTAIQQGQAHAVPARLCRHRGWSGAMSGTVVETPIAAELLAARNEFGRPGWAPQKLTGEK